MSTLLQTWRQTQGHPALAVLLPGACMKAGEMVAQGLPEAVRRRQLALDLCIVDLELAAISGGSALAALQQQVIAPARSSYRQIWLGGISLGGLLSLCHAADYPGSVDGLCLLAPYPGSRITRQRIVQAGGLEAWQPSPEELEDPEFRVWNWLKAAPLPLPAFIGYGREDRFASGMAPLAERFPPASRLTLPGGHDWSAWQPLWEGFLEFFQARAASV